ncbi:MAG: hypothetical protein OXG25_09160 [Gammaproteobacteria bacterium]|nr:hypothetical protein [Gammaproteobacteria bacterium]
MPNPARRVRRSPKRVEPGKLHRKHQELKNRPRVKRKWSASGLLLGEDDDLQAGPEDGHGRQ